MNLNTSVLVFVCTNTLKPYAFFWQQDGTDAPVKLARPEANIQKHTGREKRVKQINHQSIKILFLLSEEHISD
jgi:hypothetical protein